MGTRVRMVLAVGAALAALALAPRQAEASFVQIMGPLSNGRFSGNECGARGFANCWATQTGTVTQRTPPADPKASPVVYKRNSANNQPTGSQDFGNFPTITGAEFLINYSAVTNILDWRYTPGMGDPDIHYVAVFQAGSHILFYSATPITAGFIALSAFFPQTGWSHITFFNTGGTVVPEPATLALLGAGLLGLGLARRRRRAA